MRSRKALANRRDLPVGTGLKRGNVVATGLAGVVYAGCVDRDVGVLVGAFRPTADEAEPEVAALQGLEPHLPARAFVVRHVRQAHGFSPCFAGLPVLCLDRAR